MQIYRHISDITGTFHKRYRATGDSCYTIMVITFDGKKFYVPESQWRVIS